MEEEISTWCMTALMIGLLMLGLVLAAFARDDGMYVFGWSLFGFAIAFLWKLTFHRKAFGEDTHA